MSLTLPSAYSSASKLGNVKENWIVQLYYDNEGANEWVGISMADTTVGSVFYHGVITNIPSVRSSIDLAKSKAKTGNVSLSVVNFQYKGDDFSAELFLGSRKYINRNVKIYSQLNGDSTLANCLQVYQGRLIDISHDDASIKLTLTEQRPWDFITIPQTKSTNRNFYFPIAYGDFTPNATARDYRAIKTLRPMPVNEFRGTQLYSLIGIADVTTNAYPHYYDKSFDRFIPVSEDGSYNFDTNADSYQGGFAVQAHYELEKRVTFKPVETSSSTGWTNPDNAFDDADANETTNYASADFTQTNTGNTAKTIKFKMPQIEGKVTAVSIVIVYAAIEITILTSGSGNATYTLTNKSWGASDTFFTKTLSATGTTSTNETTDTGASLLTQFNAQGGWGDEIEIEAKVTITAGADPMSGQFQPRIKDVRILATTEVDWDEATNRERQTANKIVSDIETLYTGGDGLANSFTGGSGLADTGLEAHRDLLFRFAGFDDADGDIYNYDAELDIEDKRIDSAADEDNWDIRWWALEPVDLKKVLEQIQYEFGFIFKFRHDGTGSYWFIKDSYSSGDEAQTLKKDDIANLKINNTPFSQLLTDMRISYEKHPADDRYLSSLTSKDTTNNPRTIWNIQSKENIKEIKLDMNVNKPGNANPGGGDPNDGFADYYMNIFGDIKKIISCDIVNPAVSYDLETGDIIQFSNTAGEMPVEPFGDNWADYYMITDLQRSPGKIRIQAREVG